MARVNLSRPKVIATAQARAIPLVRSTSQKVLTGAKRLAPRGTHLSGSGRRRPGQTLVQSLREDMTVSADTVRSVIGSTKVYATTVHQGSKPHVIISKRGRKLKFRWDRGDFLAGRRGRRSRNGFFFFVKVNHPGNKRPRRFLTTPLAQFGRAAGFKVTVSLANRSFLP